MAVYTALTKLQIKALLAHFPEVPKGNFTSQGIALGTVNTYYRLQFDNGRAFYLKIDEVADKKRLMDEIRVFDFLDKRRKKLRLDVPVPLDSDNGQKFIPLGKKFVLVVPEIKGISYYHGDLTPVRMEIIGKTLKRWHQTCARTTLPAHRFDLDGQKNVFREIRGALKKRHPDLEKFIAKKLAEFEKRKPKREKSTLIHADLFAENLLWVGNDLNGIVDFDAAGKGSVYFDVGVVVHALCHDGNKFHPDKIKAFFKGYFGKTEIPRAIARAFKYDLELSAMRFLLTRLRDVELDPKGRKAKPFKDYREFARRFVEIAALF